MAGHFAPGSVPISCHIILCAVQVTLALNGEAAPAAAMIRKNVYQQMMFLQRKQMARCDYCSISGSQLIYFQVEPEVPLFVYVY